MSFLKRDARGNEIGYCRFADGRVCEEWSFLRGGCFRERRDGETPRISFAVPDASGRRLLLLGDLASSDAIQHAVCSDGRAANVRFVGRQYAGREDLGHRDGVVRFDVIASSKGYLHGGCFIMVDGFAARWHVVTRLYPKRSEVDPLLLQKMAARKGRAVRKAWPVVASDDGLEVFAVEFEPVGMSVLHSIVAAFRGKLVDFDYPDPAAGMVHPFRVDDAGAFNRRLYQVAFAFVKGERLGLAIARRDADRISLSVLLSEGERFRELRQAHILPRCDVAPSSCRPGGRTKPTAPARGRGTP